MWLTSQFGTATDNSPFPLALEFAAPDSILPATLGSPSSALVSSPLPTLVILNLILGFGFGVCSGFFGLMGEGAERIRVL